MEGNFLSISTTIITFWRRILSLQCQLIHEFTRGLFFINMCSIYCLQRHISSCPISRSFSTPVVLPLVLVSNSAAHSYTLPQTHVVCQVTRLEKPCYFPLLPRVNCPCSNSVMVSFLGESGHVINADWFSGLRKHFRLLHSIRQVQVIREMELFPSDQATFCVSLVLLFCSVSQPLGTRQVRSKGSRFQHSTAPWNIVRVYDSW
jgi:hypothetical protein